MPKDFISLADWSPQELRGMLARWAADATRPELAWTARLALRELAHQLREFGLTGLYADTDIPDIHLAGE